MFKHKLSHSDLIVIESKRLRILGNSRLSGMNYITYLGFHRYKVGITANLYFPHGYVV